MRIYLDNCCFNRPFDDQSGLIVFLETKSKLAIQRMIKDKKLSEPFDYTEWQKDLYGNMPLDEFYEKVKSARV